MPARRFVVLPALLAILAGLLVVATGAAAAPVTVRAGDSPQTTVFPSDAFTVPDAGQATGRRLALPVPGECTGDPTLSICDDYRLLNELDGFDLRPRITIPFDGPIDVPSVTGDTVYVQKPDGTRTPLVQLVFDPDSFVLAGQPKDVLVEGSVHTIVVGVGLKDVTGAPIDPCATGCAAGETSRRTTFTTGTATALLTRMATAIDTGEAYTAAGITDRTGSFTQDGFDGRTVFDARLVPPNGIKRQDQKKADPAAEKTASDAFNLVTPGTARYFAFGSYESPQFVTSDARLPQVPTRSTPVVQGKARVGFALIVPNGTPPAGGWPTVIYGPGFTRSKFDVFVSADNNAARGVATIATDPLGHGFGPASTATVQQGLTASPPFRVFGRGQDLDGDGTIADSEGVGPSYTSVFSDNAWKPAVASDDAITGVRNGLMQTVADNMALLRAVQAGMDVDGNGTPDLSPVDLGYYGLSFGGIYGTMLAAVDPKVRYALLNVPGGPITEIARTSGFRGLAATQLAVNKPSLLNGGPGRDGFTESMPLRVDPPIVRLYPGAARIQEYLDRNTTVQRSGDPVAFARMLKGSGKPFGYQVAFGDRTVPNQTSGEIARAGDLYDRISYYRNDRTPTYQTNPHGHLADPTTPVGREGHQKQMTDFVSSKGATFTDPDGPSLQFELPVANRLNLDCLHYADPQTGQAAAGRQNGPECVDKSGEAPTEYLPASNGGTGTSPGGPTSTASPSPTGSGSASPTPTATATPGTPAQVTLDVDVDRITAGNAPRLSGRVTDSSGQGVAGYEVAFETRAYAESGYRRHPETATTEADGTYELVVRPQRQTTYYATAGGAKDGPVTIFVYGRMGFEGPPPGDVRNPVTFTGRLAPAAPGVAVGLATLQNGRFVVLTQTRTDSSSGWRITRSLPAGTATYVVFTSARNGVLKGANSVRLTVR